MFGQMYDAIIDHINFILCVVHVTLEEEAAKSAALDVILVRIRQL